MTPAIDADVGSPACPHRLSSRQAIPSARDNLACDLRYGCVKSISFARADVRVGKHDVDVARPHALEHGALLGHHLFERHVEPSSSSSSYTNSKPTPDALPGPSRILQQRRRITLRTVSERAAARRGKHAGACSGLVCSVLSRSPRTISIPRRPTEIRTQKVVRIRIATCESRCRRATSSSQGRRRPPLT